MFRSRERFNKFLGNAKSNALFDPKQLSYARAKLSLNIYPVNVDLTTIRAMKALRRAFDSMGIQRNVSRALSLLASSGNGSGVAAGLDPERFVEVILKKVNEMNGVSGSIQDLENKYESSGSTFPLGVQLRILLADAGAYTTGRITKASMMMLMAQRTSGGHKVKFWGNCAISSPWRGAQWCHLIDVLINKPRKDGDYADLIIRAPCIYWGHLHT